LVFVEVHEGELEEEEEDDDDDDGDGSVDWRELVLCGGIPAVHGVFV
jgi:hypothetical protein